jgi:hypothetical protein
MQSQNSAGETGKSAGETSESAGLDPIAFACQQSPQELADDASENFQELGVLARHLEFLRVYRKLL